MAALNDARRRVATKDYKGFIKYYLPVEIIRNLRSPEQMEAMLARIEGNPEGFNKFGDLLDEMRKEKPKFNATKTEATFRLKPEKQETPATKQPAEPQTTDVKLTGFGADRNEAISKAVKLLESGKIGDFIDGMFPAGELRRPDADKRRKQILARMKQDSPAVQQMIADLKAIGALKPTLDKSGNVATYEIPGRTVEAGRKTVELPKRTIKLQKVENSWRLYDHTTGARKEMLRQAKLALPEFEAVGGPFVKFEKIGDAWRIQEIRF